MKRAFPASSKRHDVQPVEFYPQRACCSMLQHIAPPGDDGEPTVVLLTPGVYNSAYFEHTYLARQMGIEIVEGRDLRGARLARLHAHDAGAAAGGCRSTGGSTTTSSTRTVFRPDSLLGVPGLVNAYRAGNVSLANSHRHRRRRRQGDVLLRAAHDPLLPRPGPDPAERADLPRQRGRRTANTSSSTSPSWS